MIKTLFPSPFALGSLLRKYFRSGWAFLIPYLAAYLLYWWLRWPVNPTASAGGVKVTGESGRLTPSLLHSFSPPSLLHLYWALHAVNAMLAAIALVAYLRERHSGSADRNPATTPTSAENHQALDLRSSTFDLMARLAPWLLLGLLFWIPGVYLEFPADPWEHYRRINEWGVLQTVGSHSIWVRSSYFLAYSLLGQISPPTRQLFWLDFYYTGCCLLLCWQYYRLARSIGLSERASFIFVLIHALTFGNNIFGFYRYYGMSSTVFSQLGAVALVRIAIEFASSLPLRGRGAPRRSLGVGGCAALLLPLIAFNHIQGLGIAGLGLLAVVTWRLIEWRRSMIWWLAATAIVLSVAAVLWWPRNPALDAAYRPAGWLTAWYGFNVLSPRSPAGDRAIVILGFFGVINLVAGLLLLRRNHIAGWLTITPLFALCLPFIAIPFANAIAQRSVPDILTFHRMLLVIPAGLAIVSLGAEIANRKSQVPGPKFQAASLDSGTSEQPSASNLRPARHSMSEGGPPASGLSMFFLLLLTLAALLLVPADGPCYNRFWNALMVPPSDLCMDQVIKAMSDPAIISPKGRAPPRSLTTYGYGFTAWAIGVRNVTYTYRLINSVNPAATTGVLLGSMTEAAKRKETAVLLMPPTAALYSPISLSGYLSGHWPPQEAILESAAGPEIEAAARKLGGTEIKTDAGTYYSFGDWKAVTKQDR